MKKAQTEIMGIAIVVILLVVGMTFVIKFMLDRDPIDYKKSFTQAEIASNTLNTFLKTGSRDCNGLTMTELLQDCAQSRGIFCQTGKISCDYVKGTAEEIFGKTLEVTSIDYEFSVFMQEDSSIFTLGEACPGSKKSKTFPLPTSAGTLFVKLDICG
ncbi:hypothetical protein ISS07_01390 [Candidatus Woesearchaeota archaeon]|nr:hypothetical protein [Candidatus Woesearchaeota archaeon]